MPVGTGDPTSSRTGRPLAAILGCMGAYSAVRAATTTYFSIWALTVLGAPAVEVAATLAGVAVGAPLVGLLGGWTSDRLGRRAPFALALVVQGLGCLVISLHGVDLQLHLTVGGLVLLAGSFAAPQLPALIGDLADGSECDILLARLRVYQNGGYALGPPLAAGLLWFGWTALFVTLGFASFSVCLLAWKALPRPDSSVTHGTSNANSNSERNWTRLGLVIPFGALFVAGSLAMTAYSAQDALLPVWLVASEGYPASSWGLLAWLNPFLVTTFQTRTTRLVGAWSRSSRLATGTALLGLPYLLLIFVDSIIWVVVVILITTFGEILWAPAAQSAVLAISPPTRRGTFLGAFGAVLPIGAAGGPGVGLLIRESSGDTWMWLMVATAAMTGAAIAVVATGSRVQVKGKPRES